MPIQVHAVDGGLVLFSRHDGDFRPRRQLKVAPLLAQVVDAGVDAANQRCMDRLFVKAASEIDVVVDVLKAGRRFTAETTNLSINLAQAPTGQIRAFNDKLTL